MAAENSESRWNIWHMGSSWGLVRSSGSHSSTLHRQPGATAVSNPEGLTGQHSITNEVNTPNSKKDSLQQNDALYLFWIRQLFPRQFVGCCARVTSHIDCTGPGGFVASYCDVQLPQSVIPQTYSCSLATASRARS